MGTRAATCKHRSRRETAHRRVIRLWCHHPANGRRLPVRAAPRSFLDETFLPQFNALHDELTKHLDEVAKTIIEVAVHRDLTDAPEVAEPKQLSMSIGG
jgi:hypothetical protein